MIRETWLAAALFLAAVQTPAPIRLARLDRGVIPPIPIMQLAGGEIFFEATIDAEGRIADLKTLRATEGLTDLVAATIQRWHFKADARRGPAAPRVPNVLVGAFYRPPTLIGPTLGTPPVTLAESGAETPFPVVVQTPPFPPMAFSGGVVLLELRIEADGSVSDAAVLSSAPPFDSAAVDAARQWRFRPARIGGGPAASYAYILFGFPLPVG